MRWRAGSVLWLSLCWACAAGSSGPDGGAVPADASAPRDGAEAVDLGLGSDAALDSGPQDAAAEPRDAGAEPHDAGVEPGDGGPPDSAAARVAHVLVGSGDGNIYRWSLDLRTGALGPRGATAAGPGPSFLAFHPAGGFVYAVNEDTPGRVAAFRFDPASGALRLLNRVSSEGAGPAHLSVDRAGRFVLVANYGDGGIAVLPIQADGRLGAAVDARRAGDNAHQILTDPANQFAFVPCLGADNIAQYRFDALSGQLSPNAPVASAPGAGPRHLAFHPSARFAYAINESDRTITAYSYDAARGALTVLGSVSTLPAGFGGQSSCAEIAVHPSGRWVYGSNRGHDSIARLGVDEVSGQLSAIDHTPTGGRTPRSFALSADGSLLIVANQESDTLVLFQVDAASGALRALGAPIPVPRPAFVGVLEQP